jgi:hypothetical protein
VAGPEWLSKNISEWPVDRNDRTEKEFVSKQFEAEAKSTKVCENASVSAKIKGANQHDFPLAAPFGIDYQRYSTVTKLLRVTTLVKRFLRKLKGEKFDSSSITSSELSEAEKIWISYVQHKAFGDVFESLQINKRCNLQIQLGVYIDDDGLLRCKGRLENSSLTGVSESCITFTSE